MAAAPATPPVGADAMPAAASDAMPPDAVEVGRIIGAWGVQGGLKIKPISSDPQALFSSKRWYLQASETPRPPGAKAALALPALLRVKQAVENVGGHVIGVVLNNVDVRSDSQYQYYTSYYTYYAPAESQGRTSVPLTSAPVNQETAGKGQNSDLY